MGLNKSCLRCHAVLPEERRRAQVCVGCKRPSGRPITVGLDYVPRPPIPDEYAPNVLLGWKRADGWVTLR